MEAGPGGDRRPIRRDRDGDPPGAGGSRRRRRLHGHDRQRDRPRDAGPDGLFRRRSLDPRHRGVSGGRAEHKSVPRGLQGRARRRQAGHRAETRRLRRRPRRGDGAYRRARRLDRNLRCDLDPRRRDPRARPRRADRNHRMLRPCRAAEERPACRGVAVRRQARPADRRVLFGRTEFRAAQQERQRATGQDARARQHRRQSARRRLCRGGRSLRLHEVDQDHDRRSRHRHRHHRCRTAEGAA